MSRMPFLLLSVPLLMANGPMEKPIPIKVDLNQRGYEQISAEQGLRIYKDPQSNLIRLAAEGLLAVPPRQLFAALLDYNHLKGEIGRISESRILERGANWLIVYQRMNLPVISDRDYTLFVTWSVKNDLRTIRFHALKKRGPPPKDGVVRISTHLGSWQVMPSSKGNASKVRLQMSTDFAGWIPTWLARMGASRELPQLFASIKRLALKKRYAKPKPLSVVLSD